MLEVKFGGYFSWFSFWLNLYFFNFSRQAGYLEEEEALAALEKLNSQMSEEKVNQLTSKHAREKDNLLKENAKLKNELKVSHLIMKLSLNKLQKL